MSDTQISKWGNSLAVRIPRGVATEAGLSEGDQVTVDVSTDGHIVLKPARRKYALRRLVSGITTKNRHSATDWGTPRGRELW